ncbi:gas vesicle synthesis GvpLF [Actinomadura craniellae]|uniref:Gas vesicle synthesis GvpLF n=1 Tax=Actinomadura craniellae TaxID=2231787 RepID=A0A365H3E7_9ACTN|nr:GvpL/GvpF family gas vesicle protein [Actinomadura craniellae]RAY13621.1 gas vesicle synthesis GvpLF [Actinomadura craniellae]
MTDSGTYLYAIAQETGEALPDGLTGVAGTPVRTIAHAGLAGYVGTVPLAEFGEDALARNLEDLAWLEATARAHHQVVDVVARLAPTAPVRLVTVYAGDGQVRELLERRLAEFSATLDSVAGRQEWGVKVYVDPQTVARPAAGPGTAADRSGAAYLRRRRAGMRDRDDALRRATAHGDRVDAALSAVAVESRRHRAQDPRLSGRDEWMVLNGAYLVDAERGDEFATAVAALRGPEVGIELTGPWAPYSFTVLESEGVPP